MLRENDKDETSVALKKLVSIKYKGDGNIGDYILDMF